MNEGENTSLSWDDWLATQDEQIQVLIQERESGFTSSADEQRKEIRRLKQELKAANESLEATQSTLEANTRHVAFLEQVNGKISNPRLAWLAVNDGDFYNEESKLMLDSLKIAHPELFIDKSATVDANAGSGTGSQSGSSKVTMNDWFRSILSS